MKLVMRLVFLFILIFTISVSYARMPKVYVSVFEDGKVGLVFDFRENGKGLLAIMSEEGKWEIEVKGSEDVEYYKEGVLNGKLKRVGDVVIKRRTVGHEALIGQPVKIGDIEIKYYDQSESEAHYGKIMRIGDLTITYHSYQTLPSYGKISSIRKLDTNQRMQFGYHNSDYKGYPVAGKIKNIDEVLIVYNKEGKAIKIDGESDFIDVKLWTEKELSFTTNADKNDEERVEKIVDKILGVK